MKIKVNDMMCKHCEKAIDKALAELDHKIDLANKEVEVADDDASKAKTLILAAGYHVE
ncbi:MAG: cation transporter [Erysipelotrichaceae bacterium]|nr:cation transporter [Erysipelotrichaceae bacterium]MDY5252602.1 heavy metal-associated domain-containing protein [Erysipelotrichaceae bacterium]